MVEFEGRVPGLDELARIATEGVPLVGGWGIRVLSAEAGSARLELPWRGDFVRPGGTVAGPVLFGLADVALYVAVLSRIGLRQLAVTTSMTMNFLRRAEPGGLIADSRLLKVGRRLCVGEVTILEAGSGEGGPVAHAVGTYSIPPDGVEVS